MKMNLQELTVVQLKELRTEVNQKIREARSKKKSTKALEEEKAEILAELERR